MIARAPTARPAWRPRARRRPVPVVTQTSTTECGLCVAVALLGYYGRDESILDARASLPSGRNGVSLRQVATFLAERGMTTQAFRVKSVDALAKFTRPVVLFWENAHFVVLERFDGRKATIMDPARGRRTVDRHALSTHFSGTALLAAPSAGFERRRRTRLDEWRSSSLIPRTGWAPVALLTALSMASFALLLAVPLATQWLVDHRQRLADSTNRWALFAGLVGLAAGYYLLTHLRVRVLSRVMAGLGHTMMFRTFERLLALPYQFFTTRQPGELLFRLNCVIAIRDILSTKVAQGVLDIGAFVSVAAYMVVVDWRIAAVALGLVAANFTVVGLARRKNAELVDEEVAQASKAQTIQLDAIVSIPSVRLGGYDREIVADWGAAYDSSLDAMRRRMLLQDGTVGGFATVTTSFGPVTLLLVGLLLVQSQTMTLGTVIGLQMISGTLFAVSSSLFSTYSEFVESTRYLVRLNDILLSETEHPGGARAVVPAASVALDDVYFRYSEFEPDVLRGVTLDVEPGERLAIVGPSGSGKSTLARVLATLYDPCSGTVSYGGIPRDQYEIRSLRRVIGFVPQETHMHNKPLLDNLTLGREIPPERVLEVCDRLGLTELIAELPMGLHTVISEMGGNFSGGQRQRFALARVILQDPEILILDEATASLDTVNERLITDYLAELGMTQIVIAHRLATIRHANRIVVMDHGMVVETGTHDELIAGDGRYAELYERDRRPTLHANGVLV